MTAETLRLAITALDMCTDDRRFKLEMVVKQNLSLELVHDASGKTYREILLEQANVEEKACAASAELSADLANMISEKERTTREASSNEKALHAVR